MSDGGIGSDLDNVRVPHADTDAIARFHAAGVDRDFLTREELAHGQRFDPSLAVPFLDSLDADNVMARKV